MPAAVPGTASQSPEYHRAPGQIYPRDRREFELCSSASHPDWVYLAALVALDAAGIAYGSSGGVKYSDSSVVRFTGPVSIGLPWGATLGGAWLALPKCSLHWAGGAPPEGDAHSTWPLALSIALLAGATAPIVNGIAIGNNLPLSWSDEERVAHVVVAGVAGFAGALLPYLLPPRTWSAARELERLRLGVDASSGRSGVFVRYSVAF